MIIGQTGHEESLAQIELTNFKNNELQIKNL
jgi:hypothetical protein